MATLYAKTSGGNWTAAAVWSNVNASGVDNSGPPGAGDNVVFELLSGNVTIDSAAACRSIDCTAGTGNYTGTLTHAAATLWSIGDGTAGTGNVALKFSTAMTYTIVNTTTSATSFVSTSATQQSINTEGEIFGNITFVGVGGSWILGNNLTATAGTVLLTSGIFNTNNFALNCNIANISGSLTRTLTLGSSTVTLLGTSGTIWQATTITNLTFNANTSTIVLSAASVVFAGGTLTYNSVSLTGGAIATVNQTNTFTTFTRTGTGTTTSILTLGANQIVTTTLNLNGNSETNRLLVNSDVVGTTRTITNTATVVNASNLDCRDLNTSVAIDISAISGRSGDAGGNTNITFSTAAPKYWVGGTGSWNQPTTHWALSSGGAPGIANVPLPQDDVFFDANSFDGASQTVTSTMPRLGKSIDFSAVTNSPTFTPGSAQDVYGSMMFSSSMTITQTGVITFMGRGAFTITSAGNTFPGLTLTAFGGSLTLQDAFLSGSSITLNNGSFITGGFSVTSGAYNSLSTATRAINMTGSTWALSSTGNVWNNNNPSGLTLTTTNSTILITNTSASAKTFTGGGSTYNNIAIVGGGTGSITITGSNTYNDIASGAPKTILVTAGTTQTINSITMVGNSIDQISISSVTPATPFNIVDTSGINRSDWLVLQDIAFSGGATWYAGSHSTNVSGNTGITFTDDPNANVTLGGRGRSRSRPRNRIY